MRVILGLMLALVPAPLVAATPPKTFKEFVGVIIDLINTTIIPLIFALAFLLFIWGVAQYTIFSGSEERKTVGKQLIVWGIVAFFVMISVWGIVQLVSRSFFPL